MECLIDPTINHYIEKVFMFMESVEKEFESDMANFLRQQEEFTKNYLLNRSLTEKSPQKSLKKHKSVLAEVTNKSIASLRPTRKAAILASAGLKEKPLNSKMRNEVTIKTEESNNENISIIKSFRSTQDRPVVKLEKLSENILNVTKTLVTTQEQSLVSSTTKRKSNEDDDNVSTLNISDSRKKVDESVQILPADTISIVEISDNDSTTIDTDKNNEIVFVAPTVPVKKFSKQRKRQNSDTESLKDEIIVKNENNPESRSTRSTRSKKKTQPKSNVKVKNEKKKSQEIAENGEKVGNNSVESIYEDAIGGVIRESNIVHNPIVVLSKIETVIQNATFVTTNSESVDEIQKDATYIAPIKTYVVNSNDIPNATFNVPQEQQAQDEINSSLITEDNSVDNIIPEQVIKYNEKKIEEKTKTKTDAKTYGKPKNKELFNPCIQSPVKNKVAAFEKHANELQSPLPTRQTRTKTRQKEAAAENQEIQKNDKHTTTTTPLTEIRFGKQQNTPLTQSMSTPNLALNNKKGQSFDSASKVPLKKTNSVSKMPLQRDASVEDKRRQLVDEKKKKNDEKMRSAQQQREAIEKEKIYKYKKMLQEKELKQQEALRKKMIQKKMLEEAHRLREERQREVLKKAEREQMDNLRIIAEKNALHAKLKQNEANLQKASKDVGNYCFEMLHVEDSTDDESMACSKKGQPPAWSMRANRRKLIIEQMFVNAKYVDNLFSVRPTTANLREIFPAIDPRYLKRNSSAIWNTPPRYSHMPKYN